MYMRILHGNLFILIYWYGENWWWVSVKANYLLVVAIVCLQLNVSLLENTICRTLAHLIHFLICLCFNLHYTNTSNADGRLFTANENTITRDERQLILIDGQSIPPSISINGESIWYQWPLAFIQLRSMDNRFISTSSVFLTLVNDHNNRREINWKSVQMD